MTHEELLYIEPDEEITAIIDRLRQSEAAVIRLVLPKGALVLQSLVSLKLLKREADDLRKDIALVSPDPVAQHLAEEANLTVYAKPKDKKPIFTVVALPTEHTSRPQSSTAADTDDNEPIADEVPEGIHVHHYHAPDDAAPAESAPADHPGASEPDAEIPTIEEDTASADDEPTTPASTHHLIDQAIGRRPRRRSPLTRLAMPLLALAAVAFLAYVAFLEFVPGANIQLALATEPLEQAVTVTAEPSVTEPDLANARIPGRILTAEHTVEHTAPATGKKQVGNKATGSLTLYNYWDANPQNLAAGTTLLAGDGTNFATTQAATIPGASTTLKEGKVVTTPGKTSVTIEAAQPGPDANGKTGQFRIPSLPSVRQDKIYGEANAPTAGGTSKEVTIITEADRETLHNTAMAALTEQAADQVSKDLADGERLLDGAIGVEVSRQEYSAEVGAEAEQLRVVLTGTVRGLVFADEHLKNAAIAVLTQSIPSARMLVLTDQDELVTTTKQFDTTAERLEVQIVVKSRTALTIDTEALIDKVTGLPIDEAKETLKGAAGVEEVTIQLRPRWLSRLPKHASQIQLHTTYAPPEPTETPAPAA